MDACENASERLADIILSFKFGRNEAAYILNRFQMYLVRAQRYVISTDFVAEKLTVASIRHHLSKPEVLKSPSNDVLQQTPRDWVDTLLKAIHDRDLETVERGLEYLQKSLAGIVL
jgi:hypothetical protein